MKRILSSLLILLLLGSLCACGKKPAAPDAEAQAAQAVLETVSEEGLRLSQTSSVGKEKFEGEKDFAAFLSSYEKSFVIPGLNEGAIPQGMAYSEETGRIYLSSYYSSDLPSVLTAVDAQTLEFCAEYFLYEPDGSAFHSHVGGLACTGDALYVSATLDNDGSYSIARIPLEQLSGTGSHDLTIETRIPLPVSPSFLNCSGGYLWAGNFYYPKANYDLPAELSPTDGLGCYILGYRTDRDLTTEALPVPDLVLAAPDRIQGFVQSGASEFLLSQSYGRKNNSTLLGFSPDLTQEAASSLELCGTSVPLYLLTDDCQSSAVTAMPMTEALCLGPDGSVLVLFESGALHYADGLFRTDCVWKQLP